MIKKTKIPSSALRANLLRESSLQDSIHSGLRALGSHSSQIEDNSGRAIDSLDFDNATAKAKPQENRWDYFVGTKHRGIIGVEIHSAKDSEVSVVIAKKKHSKPAMQEHLRDGSTIAGWIWLASGKVRFSPNSRYLQILAQNRIEFAGRKLLL